MGTIQSINLFRPLSKPWTPLLSRGTIQCIYLVWALLNSLEPLIGTIQSINLVRHIVTLRSPALTGNNTLYTFKQTSVENTRPPTPTGYNTVHTFGQTSVEILYSPTFTGTTCILLGRSLSKTIDSPTLIGYNIVHTFSKTPVDHPRLLYTN